MKTIFFIILCAPLIITAQNRTNIWELGYSLSSSPACELRYQNGTMDTFGVNRVMTFWNTNASICDTNGNLLFYSNGLTVGNRNYDTLLNAVNFNPGWATDLNETFGMNNCQGVIFLPDPGNDKRYYLFHETGESFYSYGANQVQPLHLSYSVIDLNLDSGMGGIIDTLKNKYAIEDTLMWGGLTAVKHANGRDWWVIAHRFWTDKIYKLLLTPQGLLGPYVQTIGSDSMNDIFVQATFSSDGSKYCLSSKGGWLDYMKFDRCSGEFSNAITVYNPDSVDHYFYGNSFSPNSRFIYASSTHNLYQYDTWDSNMIANVTHIAAWDSFYDPVYHIAVLFFMHQYAPDGKIYLGTFNGSKYLNVINSPDSSGIACNFSPHSYVISHDSYGDIPPSFPNYDLGPLKGSPCDTLYLQTENIKQFKQANYRVAPNLVNDWLNIIYQTDFDALLNLYDINGKLVVSTSLFHYFKNRLINVSHLPNGVYLAVVLKNGENVWIEKVVVQH